MILYGDGEQERDFTFVEDIARGTVAALRPMGYEVINLGGDRPVKMNALIKMIEARLGGHAIKVKLPEDQEVPGESASLVFPPERTKSKSTSSSVFHARPASANSAKSVGR